MATEEGEGFRETEWETGYGQAERHTGREGVKRTERATGRRRNRKRSRETSREGVGRQAERELGHKRLERDGRGDVGKDWDT